jgi:hypothetical protein
MVGVLFIGLIATLNLKPVDRKYHTLDPAHLPEDLPPLQFP